MASDVGRNERHVREAVRTSAPEADHPYRLSLRELDVLELLAQGLNNAEIAWELSVSQATVNKHVSSVIGKMRARSRTDAVAKAFRGKIVR